MTYLTVLSGTLLDDFASVLQLGGFGASSSGGRTGAPDVGSGDAGYAGTDGLDLSGFASLGHSLASLSAASGHDAGSGLSADALASGFSLGAAPSDLSDVRSADALSFDAAALKGVAADAHSGGSVFPDVSHGSTVSAVSASGSADFHAFDRSVMPVDAVTNSSGQAVTSADAIKTAGFDGSSDGGGKTALAVGASPMAWGVSDFDVRAMSNLGAADTFHFASDFGSDTDWSGVRHSDVHVDLAWHVTFDDLLGADHAVLPDYGAAFDALHADPLKDVAHASQHGDDFHAT